MAKEVGQLVRYTLWRYADGKREIVKQGTNGRQLLNLAIWYVQLHYQVIRDKIRFVTDDWAFRVEKPVILNHEQIWIGYLDFKSGKKFESLANCDEVVCDKINLIFCLTKTFI
jgi:hypothetical protein